MERIIIDVPDHVLSRLQQIAEGRGITLNEVILEALVEKADSIRPVPQTLGMFASGYTDISLRSGEELPEPPPFRGE